MCVIIIIIIIIIIICDVVTLRSDCKAMTSQTASVVYDSKAQAAWWFNTCG